MATFERGNPSDCRATRTSTRRDKRPRGPHGPLRALNPARVMRHIGAAINTGSGELKSSSDPRGACVSGPESPTWELVLRGHIEPHNKKSPLTLTLPDMWPKATRLKEGQGGDGARRDSLRQHRYPRGPSPNPERSSRCSISP